MSNDITLGLRIRVNADGSAEVLDNTGRRVRNIGNAADSASRSVGSMVASLAAMAVGTLSLAQAGKEIGSFESRMINVKALTSANSAEMALLEKQARELGATTAFSGQQAAEAQGVLAAAGLRTNEILKATPGVMELASAGSIGLSQATEIAIGTLRGMGLELSQLGHINDVFAKTAGDTQANVSDLGAAISQVAPLAKLSGISIDDLAASFGILANNNIKGATAGDQLKSMLNALAKETKSLDDTLATYGLTFKDVDISARGFLPVLATLGKANLSAADTFQIFGTESAAVGTILTKGKSEVEELSKALKEADGAASAMAMILNQGLEKEIDALYGAVSEAVLQLGDGGLKGGLSNLITTVTGVISVYEGMGVKFAESNNLTREQYQNLRDIAGELQVVAGAAGGIATLTAGIWLANTAMAAFNATMALNPYVLIGGVALAGIGAVIGNIRKAKSEHEAFMTSANSLDEQNLKIKEQIAKVSSLLSNGIQGKGNGSRAGESSRTAAMADLKTLVEQRDAIEKKLAAENAAAAASAKAATQADQEKAKQLQLAAGYHTVASATDNASKAKDKAAKAAKTAADAEKELQDRYLKTISTLKDEGNALDIELQAFSLTKEGLSELKEDYRFAALETQGYTSAMAAQVMTQEAGNAFTKEKIALLKQESDAMGGLIDKNIELSLQTQVKDGKRVLNPNAEQDAMLAKMQVSGVDTTGTQALLDANRALEARNAAIKFGTELTKELAGETAVFTANMALATQAFNAGSLSQADYNKYLAQQHDLMVANSEAGKQEAQFFSELDRITSAGFEAMLKNGQSATEAMRNMFTNMIDSITASFLKLAQNSLFDLLSGKSIGAGGWQNIAVGIVAAGASILGGMLQRDAPIRTQSYNEQNNNSAELGSGALHIADKLTRDYGFGLMSAAVVAYNANVDKLMTTLASNADTFVILAGKVGKALIDSSITSGLSGVFGGISSVINALQSGVAFVKQGFLQITSYVYQAISGATEAAAQAATTGLGNAVSKAVPVIGAIVAVYSAVSGILDAAGNDALSFGAKVRDSLYAVSDSLLFFGLANVWNPVGWGSLIAAAVTNVMGAFTDIAENGFNTSNIVSLFGGWLGRLFMGLFADAPKPRIEFTQSTETRRNDAIFTDKYPSGQSTAIHTFDRLGHMGISALQMGMSEKAIKAAFLPLMTVVTAVDNGLAAAVDKMDLTAGTAGATLQYFRKNFGDLENTVKAQSVNMAALLNVRYKAIAKTFAESGTVAGEVFGAWFTALNDKFLMVNETNVSAVLGIVAAVSGSLDKFAALPLELAALISSSVKGVALGQTAEQVTSEINNVLNVYAVVLGGLRDIGFKAASGAFVANFLAGMNAIGYTVETAGANFLAYAAAFRKTNPDEWFGKLLADFAGIQKRLKTLGFSQDQKNAFFGSFGTLSSLFAEQGVAFNQTNLIDAAIGINTAAEASSRAAKEAINHAIAENNLTEVSRESALQTLIRTKAVDEATVAEAEYGFAITDATKSLLDGLGFIQSFAVIVGKTLGGLGVSADSWVKAGNGVVKVFGDMQGASEFFDRITKGFLTDDEQKLAAKRVADNNVASLVGANKSLGAITVDTVREMLLTGKGLDEVVNALANGDKSVFTYIDAILAQKNANDALTGSLANMKTVADDVRKYLDSLKTGELSTLSPDQKLRETKQQFTSTLASANLGNATAAGNLTTVADAYLKEARGFFASGSGYINVYNTVTALLKAFADKPDGSHAGGLGYVPFDGYRAELHKGERVLTAREAAGYDNTVVNNSFATDNNLITNPSNTVIYNTVTGLLKAFADKAGQPDGSHAGGLGYVPFDGYRAELHKGERVLTAREAAGYDNTVVNNSFATDNNLITNPSNTVIYNTVTGLLKAFADKAGQPDGSHAGGLGYVPFDAANSYSPPAIYSPLQSGPPLRDGRSDTQLIEQLTAQNKKLERIVEQLAEANRKLEKTGKLAQQSNDMDHAAYQQLLAVGEQQRDALESIDKRQRVGA